MPEGRILFWNVQHLSEGSELKKTERIRETLRSQRAGVKVLCEVYRSFDPDNVYRLAYRSVTAFTLGYYAVNQDNDPLEIRPVEVEVAKNFAKQMKGGVSPPSFMNRKLGEVIHGIHGMPRLFVLHAHAKKGQHSTTVSTMYLDASVATPWIMVGDFNAEPCLVTAWLKHFKSGGSVFAPDDWTHSSTGYRTLKTGNPAKPLDRKHVVSEKKLDYAISKGAKCVVKVVRRRMSDHRPILVDWAT